MATQQKYNMRVECKKCKTNLTSQAIALLEGGIKVIKCNMCKNCESSQNKYEQVQIISM